MTASTENEPKPSAESAAGSVDAGAEGQSPEAMADTADAEAGAVGAAKTEPKPGPKFGGLTPSEAASKRWKDKRAREEAEALANANSARGEVALVRVTVEVGAVIDKLAREAKGGNVQAARELREWLGKVEAETDTSVSALDRRTRQAMKARLLSELEEGHSPIAPLPLSAVTAGSEQGTVLSGASGQLAEASGGGHPAARRDSDDATA